MVLHRTGLILAVILFLSAAGALAGEINPPGSPASTLIAGVPVATPITSVPISIDEPGVYYLTDSFTVASDSAHAITVTADDIVIDLAGFSLVGPGTGTGRGVSAETAVRITIQNGTIRNFGAEGICLGENGIAEDLRIEDCGTGVNLGRSGSARRLQVRGCDIGGIQVFIGSEIVDCVVESCEMGIGTYFGSAVSRCAVRACGTYGIGAVGTTVVSDCSAINVTGDAFLCQAGAIIDDCSAMLCGRGFVVNAATITDCTATQCSVEGIATAAGTGSSRIEGNHVQGAPIGIRVDQPALVSRNFINTATTVALQISATDVAVMDNVFINSTSAILHTGTGTNCIYARNVMTSGVSLGTSPTYGPLVFGSGNLSGDAGSENPWSNIMH